MFFQNLLKITLCFFLLFEFTFNKSDIRNEIIKNLTSNNPNFKTINLTEIDEDSSFLNNIYDALIGNKFSGNILWSDNKVPTNKEIVNKIYDKLWENNKKFERFPNYFVHSLLSKHVYIANEHDINEQVKFSLKDESHIYNNGLKNWFLHKIFRSDKTGYFGAIYLNKAANQIVLAHRGTELTDFGDLEADIKGVFEGNKVDHQIACLQLTEYAINCSKKNQYYLCLYFTISE